jgi:murein L,D-transpeptidase YafK
MRRSALALACLALSGLGIAQADIGLIAQADRVVVEKSRRTLTLYADGQPIRAYRVALGINPKGPKVQEGDGRTPEGEYHVDYRVPRSAFHRALHISYPNPQDRARAEALGVSPGGNIMIHGLRNGRERLANIHALADWTEGCIAVTNDEMNEIWRLVGDGTTIEIRP